MSSEIFAFANMFGAAIAISQDLSEILPRQPPVQLLHENHCPFEFISKGSQTSAKRTMLDIAAEFEAFQDHAISDISFVRSIHNLADGLTKPV